MAFALALEVSTFTSTARAFDYLEHSFFADRGCRVAQEQLAARFATQAPTEAELARYLALAIACPNRWPDPAKAPYCAANGYKRLEANMNHLPSEADGVAITIGDFAALPDHISDFGPVRSQPKETYAEGLAQHLFGWIAQSKSDGAGGVIGDVSEDACEHTEHVPWAEIEAGIMRASNAPGAPTKGGPGVGAEIALPLLSPLARATPPQGPHDNAGAYSFDNPHFLDLIQRNADHFGDRAYGAWLGHHSTAVEIAARKCEDVVAFEANDYTDWSDGLKDFEAIRWSKLAPEDLRKKGCLLLERRVRARLHDWLNLGEPSLVTPVRAQVEKLSESELDRVVAATLSLAFEGTGLHYLEDTLSAGHLRAVQDRRGLAERRYDHDLDSRDGVVAELRTASGGERAFVAFGDGYLLGPQAPTPAGCEWAAFAARAPSPEILTACLLENQRRILVAAAASSLLDWAREAPVTRALECGLPKPKANASTTSGQFICENLPLGAPRVPGLGSAPAPAAPVSRIDLGTGTLPVPPPPFAYESLSFQMGLDAAGSGNQVGLKASLFTQLGPAANWLTSHNLGLRYVTQPRGNDSFAAEYGYGFHWRWAARFLLDAEPAAMIGFRDRGQGREFMTAFAPRFGTTVLPEGWVKIPLQLSFSYRPAFMIYDSRDKFFGPREGIGRHWIEFGVGLAFL